MQSEIRFEKNLNGSGDSELMCAVILLAPVVMGVECIKRWTGTERKLLILREACRISANANLYGLLWESE